MSALSTRGHGPTIIKGKKKMTKFDEERYQELIGQFILGCMIGAVIVALFFILR
jgi:hypothetical protein